MNIAQGPHYIDDTLTVTVTTHDVATGALTDADAVPAYRVYEDETGTAILTGNMAKLDDTNTTGFYSEQLTLSAANGFEVGKSYSIYATAAVDSVTGGTSGSFKVIAAIPTAASVATAVLAAAASDPIAANVKEVDDDATAASNLESYTDGTAFMPVDAHKPNFSVSGSTLTVKQPDGTTTAYTKTVTSDAAADPITGAS